MEVTTIELDLTERDGEDSAVGALIGLFFLLVLVVLARWSRSATTDK